MVADSRALSAAAAKVLLVAHVMVEAEDQLLQQMQVHCVRLVEGHMRAENTLKPTYTCF